MVATRSSSFGTRSDSSEVTSKVSNGKSSSFFDSRQPWITTKMMVHSPPTNIGIPLGTGTGTGTDTFPKNHRITIDVDGRLKHQEDQIIEDLTRLRDFPLKGSLKEFIIRSCHSERVVNAILATFQQYADVSADQWGSLVLETSDDAVLAILKHSCVVSLFRGVVVEARESSQTDILMTNLETLYRYPGLRSLSLRRCKLTPNATLSLQRLLEGSTLKRLELYRVEFTDPLLSGLHIRNGLKANLGLIQLEIHSIENQDILFPIFDSLHGNPSLTDLIFAPCWSNKSVPRLLETLSHVLAHPDCRIEKFQLTCWNGSLGDSFWNILSTNQSLREISLIGLIKDGDLVHLTRMATNSPLVKIHADIRINDLGPYMHDCDKNVPLLRSLQLDLIQLEKNRHKILKLVSEDFPYLYQLSNVGPNIPRMIRSYLQQGTAQSLEKAQCCTQIGLCLEQNQVGRALLLPSVVDTIPLGLWPNVLAKAANSNSILYDQPDHQTERPPMDGIHYMMQGLLPYLFSAR